MGINWIDETTSKSKECYASLFIEWLRDYFFTSACKDTNSKKIKPNKNYSLLNSNKRRRHDE